MGRVPGFVKWIVAPALAVAAGFYGVAPLFRGKPIPKFVKEAAERIVTPKTEPTADSPNVRVDVKPVEEDAPRRR